MTTSTKGRKASTTRKAATKSIAAKPDAAKVAAATNKAVQGTIKMVSAHTITASSKTPYKALTATRSHFSGYTIAASIVAKLAAMQGNGPATIAKGGSVSLFRALVGSSATSHWTSKGRIDKDGLTVAGINEVQARLAGVSKGYDTSKETVQAFVQAMQKGGKVELDGKVYEFGSQVSVKA